MHRPVIDPKLPNEQAGFRHEKSAVDQVTLLINDTFQASDKAGLVFLDFTAAYDTIWLRGLHLKLFQTAISWTSLEMLTNCSFTLHTSDGQHSRLRRLRNGVPEGSALAPMLFNIYLPPTLAKKNGYTDNLAILLFDKRWDRRGPYCRHVNLVHLPQELAPKVQHREL